MDAVIKKNDYTLITVIFAFFVFFTASDLMFNAFSKLEFASICSFICGFLVFLGSYIAKRKNIEKGINNRIDYILSNFNWANKVLGILDFVFSVIALLTTVYWLGVIFRVGVIIRLTCTLNKIKSVLKTLAQPLRAFLIVVFTYLTIRFNTIKNKVKESKMGAKIKSFFQWIRCNWKSILSTLVNIVSSVVAGYATYGGMFDFIPSLMWLGINWSAVIVAVVIFVLLQLGITGAGFEKIATWMKRVAEEKQAKEDAKIEKQAKKELKQAEKEANKTQAQAEAEAKKAEAKAKAEAEKAQAKAEAEAKAKAEAEAYRAKVEAKKAELQANQNK